MASYIDKTIGGYKIKKFIAKGGMGSVFYAKHPVLKERPPVAIKVLHRHLLETGNLKERFRREANLQARLRHKSLIRLLEYLEDEKDCYIIMEYFESKSLSDIIGRQTGPISFKRAVPIFQQILEGIQYAHDNDIIHRDIKPSNVLVDNNDIVKITDFGIAKAVGDNSMTATGSVVGTRLYMSPEQIQGKRATKKSDIYSLGVTFYEMLAGRVPFESSNEFTVMEGHINKKPDPPTKHYPHIPENIVDSVMKAMEKKPGSRFNDCNEFIQATKGKIKVSNKKQPVVKPKKKKEEKAVKKSWHGWAATILTGLVVLSIYLSIDEDQGKSNSPIKPVIQPVTKVVTKVEDSAQDYYEQGMKQYKLKKWKKAIKLFNQALDRKSNHYVSMFQRGWSYYYIKNYKDAKKDADHLIKYRKLHFEYGLRGWILTEINKGTAALDDFNKAVEMAPQNMNHAIGRGFLKYKRNNMTGAFNDADKVVKKIPEDARGYHLRGLVWFKRNLNKKGCDDLKKSLFYDPTNKKVQNDYSKNNCN